MLSTEVVDDESCSPAVEKLRVRTLGGLFPRGGRLPVCRIGAKTVQFYAVQQDGFPKAVQRLSPAVCDPKLL